MWLWFPFQLLSLLALLGPYRTELSTLEKSENARQYPLHDDIFGPARRATCIPVLIYLLVYPKIPSLGKNKNKKTKQQDKYYAFYFHSSVDLVCNHLPLRHAQGLGILLTWIYLWLSKTDKPGTDLDSLSAMAISDAIRLYSLKFRSALPMKVFDTAILLI